jgi:thiamine-monophosphate kinase
VCVDQCVEGVHFERSAPADRVGRKAAARAISDLAATAARPRAVLLALDAPAGRQQAWMEEAIRGVRRMARSVGADLVGGDVCASPGPVRLSVTAIGEFAGRSKPPGRDRARVGQHVLLTGPVGGSILGRHLRIRPRVEEGIWLFGRGATALMDVSDGLAWDAYRLARASGVAIEIHVECVPLHADARRRARSTARTALDHALHDGEDHELIATAPGTRLDRILRESAAHCPRLRTIGRVVRGSGLWLVHGDGRRERWTSGRGGFRHGV